MIASADVMPLIPHSRGMRSGCSAVLAAAAVSTGTVAVAAASPTPTVSVPRTTAVGAEVRVTLRGFPPRTKAEIHLLPSIHRGGNCCGIEPRLRSGRRTNTAGAAVARFRWPEYYLRCGAASGCERIRWLQGQRADVLVLVGTVRQIKVVRLIP